MDALSDVLRAVRLSGAVFFNVSAFAPWVAETPRGREIVAGMFPGSDHLISYHVITSGDCFAVVEGEPALKLQAGDVVVFPHGDTHVLTSRPGLRSPPDLSMYQRREGVPMGPLLESDARHGKTVASKLYGQLLEPIPRHRHH